MTVIVCTYTNKGYLPYIENLSKMCVYDWKLNVICSDQESVDFCIEKSITYIPCFFKDTISEFNSYFDKNFNKLTFQKLDSINYVLKMFPNVENIIYIDGDIAVFKDFVPKLMQYKKYDIAIQCDEPHTNSCFNTYDCKILCTGFMMLKNTTYIQDLLNYSKHVNDIQKYPSEQEYVIDMYHKKFKYIISLTTLNREEFPNGKFIKNIPEKAYILHYNYLIGNKKQEEMHKNGHWRV